MSHNSRGRYSMETQATTVGIKSVLTVRNIVKADEDKYACAMENPFGRDVKDIYLVVQGRTF